MVVRGQASTSSNRVSDRPVRHGQCSGGRRQGRPRRQAADHRTTAALTDRQPRRLAAPGARHLRIPADQLATVRKSEPVRIALGVRGRAHPVLLLRAAPTTPACWCPRAPWSAPASAATAWSASCRAEQTGHVTGITQMGGEGAQWIGTAPFVEDPHFFQNMGDGTYFHSGQLAVQAAIASGHDDDVQDPLQRRGRDDRRAGRRRSAPVPEMATDADGRGRQAHHDHHRRPRPSTAASISRPASMSCTATPSSTRRRSCGPSTGHGAHPRPAVRGREASRPQARHPAHARRSG